MRYSCLPRLGLGKSEQYDSLQTVTLIKPDIDCPPHDASPPTTKNTGKSEGQRVAKATCTGGYFRPLDANRGGQMGFASSEESRGGYSQERQEAKRTIRVVIIAAH